MMLPIILIFSLTVGLTNAELLSDFCVADTSLPETPSGYQCKSTSKVTIDDFVYSGFGAAANTSTNNILKSAGIVAFDTHWPALNGIGMGTVRLDVAVGGFIPFQIHPRGSEILNVIEGKVLAGFVSTTNVPYYRTLNKGDVILFPQGLIHFLINIGNTSASSFSVFSSANPGIQTVNYAVFGNSLPSELIDKITLMDDAQVKKLKALFGGTN